ncbi:MAG: succinate dehydrogenase, hydrophobic membrane anchor protein [Roseovarius sp.]|nr:succinate dehydrogenase, hydrophobic membrane anchor protein [Roseovarius sp.]
MRYLTARKRAEGKGAAGSGPEHHWHMIVSAAGLALIVPTFIYVFGRTLGGSYDEVIARLSHPGMALLTGLVLFVGMIHFRSGATVMIEDYSRGTARKLLLIALACLTYGTIATGLFALGRIAF